MRKSNSSMQSLLHNSCDSIEMNEVSRRTTLVDSFAPASEIALKRRSSIMYAKRNNDANSKSQLLFFVNSFMKINSSHRAGNVLNLMKTQAKRVWWFLIVCICISCNPIASIFSRSASFSPVCLPMAIMFLLVDSIHITTVEAFLHHPDRKRSFSSIGPSATFRTPLHQTPPLSPDGDSESIVPNGGGGGGGDSERGRHAQNSQLQRHYSFANGNHVDISDDCKNGTSAISPTARENGKQQELLLQQRVTQLEELVAKQAVNIKRLQDECNDLTEAAAAFAKVIELLRSAGLNPDLIPEVDEDNDSKDSANGGVEDSSVSSSASSRDNKRCDFDDEGDFDDDTVLCLDDDSDVFGKAPSNVLEAADAAGASILAALLGGQQRLLVDVRDAELTSSAETFVQFLELAILPVAAGLEGLRSKRNRLKIVFPTMKQLLQYRKTMALAAPEVVALSTLNLDPVEPQDNLVVFVAPAPDDEEGCQVMNELLQAPNAEVIHGSSSGYIPNHGDDLPSRHPATKIRQPVVVFNPHMGPIKGPAASFEVAYQLRLLSVQYVSSQNSPGKGFVQNRDLQKEASAQSADTPSTNMNDTEKDVIMDKNEDDEQFEAAMRHAHRVSRRGPEGENETSTRVSGNTRAMVIRAYPNPWHVFVDTSPDTDADFDIAGTFDSIPSSEDIQLAIIESLEGSRREDELVSQQMQEALETGQLDHVGDMLGGLGLDVFDDEDDDDLDDLWGLLGVDSV